MSAPQFAGARIFTSRKYASCALDHRLVLRQDLHRLISEQTRDLGVLPPPDLDTLLDVARRPRIQGWAISIAHCHELGGFIARPSRRSNGAEEPLTVGLDLEVTHRLHRKVLERIASFSAEKKFLAGTLNDESAAVLWVIKEAAIKVFGNFAPDEHPHFGDVEITGLDPARRTFLARRGDAHCEGVFFELPEAPSVLGAAAIFVSE